METQVQQDKVLSCALVVAGSPEPCSPYLVRNLAQRVGCVVAVDRGLDVCFAASVVPQLLVGDEDSASASALAWARAAHVEELVFPREKYATDLAVALDELEARGIRKLVVSCVTGGRPDHALAVLGLLASHAHLAPQVREDAFELRILSTDGDAAWQLGADDVGNTFSFVPLTDACVSLQGMHWELDQRSVGALSDLGISNVVDKDNACISVQSGTVAAWLHNNT